MKAWCKRNQWILWITAAFIVVFILAQIIACGDAKNPIVIEGKAPVVNVNTPESIFVKQVGPAVVVEIEYVQPRFGELPNTIWIDVKGKIINNSGRVITVEKIELWIISDNGKVRADPEYAAVPEQVFPNQIAPFRINTVDIPGGKIAKYWLEVKIV